jgi:hypothetical protein
MRPESDLDHYPCTYSLRQIFVQILGLASKTLNWVPLPPVFKIRLTNTFLR